MPHGEFTHHWVAHYQDGSRLTEMDARGRLRSLALALARSEHDGPRLVQFDLVPADEGSGLPSYGVRLTRGDQLIFWRGFDQVFRLEPGEGWVPGDQYRVLRCMKLGWRRKLKTRTVMALQIIYPDGTVILSDRDADIDPFQPIIPTKGADHAAE